MSKVLRFNEKGEGVWVEKSKAGQPGRAYEPDVVSDSLGVTKWQVDEFREDARKNGFHIDFVEDKGPSAVEGFYPAKGSPSEIARYERHRFKCNAELHHTGSGNVLTGDDIEAAKRIVRAKYSEPKGRGK